MPPADAEKGARRKTRGRKPAPHPDELEALENLENLENLEEKLDEAGVKGFFPDILRRGLAVGFTGLFMTEEALRKALGDSVPRDWIEFFVEQSDRTRAELVDRISKEFGRVLTALDPVEVIRRLVDGQTIEVSAKIRLASSDPEKGPSGSSVSNVKVSAGKRERDE
jgi:hypothetical protein